MILSLVKRLKEAEQLARSRDHWMVIPGNVRLLRNMTVGILGAGEIGAEVIRLLKPFGCRVVYNDLQPDKELETETGAEYVSWEELFKASDVITLHLPYNKGTDSIVNVDEFEMMKEDAIIINTSRGGIIDEEALVKALEDKEIGGAYLDVFRQEPLPPNNPLNYLSNVLITPHIAWASPWTLVNDANTIISGVADSIRSNLKKID
jgi:phosphoglycerate dehydrogenase-like enzyme